MAYSDLKTTCLRELFNLPFQKIIFIVVRFNIYPKPHSIKSEAKNMAYALSCFNNNAIANFCSH